MKPILYGAVLALLWLLFGVPLAAVAGTLSALVQPVTLAFAAGFLVHPHMMRVKGRTA